MRPCRRAALLLARAGGTLPPLLDVAQLPATLAALSLALCDLDEGTRTTLGQAGITTFGQLAALPRDGLARRFGADVVAFTDQALGLTVDPRPPFVPAPRFSSRLDLPVPVHEVEALTFAVNRLLQTFCTWLAARGLGVTRFTLLLAHERYIRQRGLAATQVRLSLGAPARTARTCWASAANA